MKHGLFPRRFRAVGSGGAEARLSRGTFDLTLNGRRFTVTVSSSRRTAEEMLREFVEIFGDRIPRLH
jgi:hypothetical protein